MRSYKITVMGLAILISTVTGALIGYYKNNISNLIGNTTNDSRAMDAVTGGLGGFIGGSVAASDLEPRYRRRFYRK